MYSIISVAHPAAKLFVGGLVRLSGLQPSTLGDPNWTTSVRLLCCTEMEKTTETAWLFDFLLTKILLKRNNQEPDVGVRCLDELEDLDTYQHGSTHVMPLMNLHLATSAVHVWHSGKRGQDGPGSRHCNAACARAKPQKTIEHICITYPLPPRLGCKTVSIYSRCLMIFHGCSILQLDFL